LLLFEHPATLAFIGGQSGFFQSLSPNHLVLEIAHETGGEKAFFAVVFVNNFHQQGKTKIPQTGIAPQQISRFIEPDILTGSQNGIAHCILQAHFLESFVQKIRGRAVRWFGQKAGLGHQPVVLGPLVDFTE